MVPNNALIELGDAAQYCVHCRARRLDVHHSRCPAGQTGGSASRRTARAAASGLVYVRANGDDHPRAQSSIRWRLL